MTDLTLLGSDERFSLGDLEPVALAGAMAYRAPDGRLIAPAFRGRAVDLGKREPPDEDDDDALADVVIDWVEAVRAHDWTPDRGAPLEADGDWLDLRTAMVRVGWGPAAAEAAFQACSRRPYSPDLPTAAGWAAAGWVVPASAEEPPPAFARPVLEARGLLRWAYIVRWADPVALPAGAPPTEPEPADLGWADVLSRLRQDHYTEEALAEAEDLAVELLSLAGLGPRSAAEADDDPLPDGSIPGATSHASPLIRSAAWFLLRAEADAWVGCAYAECQHHWAVEAEADAYELAEVLEMAGYGVANPVDAAYQRRRLLELAFGAMTDVPLAGAGDVSTFVEFYTDWVARGRDEEAFEEAARALRGDDH